jgi:acyl-CoA reductase-like NAD-dependent aldehyde dehydrogenase
MFKITSPATGEVIKSLEADLGAAVKEKFKRAQQAQGEWAKVAVNARVDILRKFRTALEKDKEDLARTLTSEVGKPISQSRNEIQGTLSRIDFFLGRTAALLEDEVVLKEGNMEEVITHEPLGVIANISAWNYPYFVGSNVFVPALLTGNAVLYKPSEFSTLTGLAIAERMHSAGVPKDVFVPVIGDGLTGTELLKEPVNGVFFTGSFATGKKIAEAVAGRMIKIQLELGGKDPVYVCEDAPIGNAAEGLADGAFYNTGQSCCSVERIYVHAKIYDAFVEHFMKTVGGFVVGDPLEDKTYIGPLTRQPQISALEAQVKDALAKGAKLLCGGKAMRDRKGYYFEPTVLTDVNHKMEVMREESFGPIIGIQKVQDDDEALKLMNDTTYGLTAGIYTLNRDRARKILAQVNAGSVYWNCCDRVSPRLPWSGRGHSGIGSTLSVYGIQTFLQPKAWHLRG